MKTRLRIALILLTCLPFYGQNSFITRDSSCEQNWNLALFVPLYSYLAKQGNWILKVLIY